MYRTSHPNKMARFQVSQDQLVIYAKAKDDEVAINEYMPALPPHDQ